MSNNNSPVGLGLVSALMGGSLAAGGISADVEGLIVDPGTDPPSGGPDPATNQVFSGLFWASRVLTIAQCRALNSVPQTLVLGTPNSLIVPVIFVGRFINPGAVVFNVNVNVQLRYGGAPNQSGTLIGSIANMFSNSGATMWHGIGAPVTTQYFSGSGVDSRGRDLIVYGNQDCTGGAPTAFCQFWVLYTRLLSTQ